MAARRRGSRRLRQGPSDGLTADTWVVDPHAAHVGDPRRLVAGGVHRRAPTPSTPSRSCRWPPSCLAGSVACSTSAPARARSPAWPTRRGARVVGLDPTRGPDRRGGTAARRAGLRPGRRPPRCPFGDDSFDAVVACLVFEHIDDVDEAIAEVGPGPAARRPVRLLPEPPVACRRPSCGWIDDQVLDPPEQYWRIGPVPRRGRHGRGGREGRVHPVRPPPAQPIRERAGRRRSGPDAG